MVPENGTDPRRIYDTESARIGKGHAYHEVDDSSTCVSYPRLYWCLPGAGLWVEKPVDNKIKPTRPGRQSFIFPSVT